MAVRPCLTCQAPTSAGSRCPNCQRAHDAARDRRRGTTTARGMGADWQRAAREQVESSPWCAVRGCTRGDLTADHVVPRSQGGTAANGLITLCRHHNSSRGDRPLAEFLAQAEKDLQR